jgi:plasmid maintenance system killer protein
MPGKKVKKLLISGLFYLKVIIFDNYCILLCQNKQDCMLIIEYEDEAIETLIKTGQSSDKRYKKLVSNATFKKDLSKVILILRSVSNVKDLGRYGQLHYEALKYDLASKSSVRIGYSSKYRLIFEEFDNGIRINLIEINEHYGDK